SGPKIRFGSDRQNAATQLAGPHVNKGLVDVGEVVDLADHVTEGHAVVEVEADVHGDVVVRLGGPEAAAEDRLVVVEGVHHEAGLGAELGHAEEHALAAPVEQVDGGADQ